MATPCFRRKILLISFLAICLLPACARKPISAEQQKAMRVISALTFLGDEFVVDVTSRSVIRAKVATLDIRPWKMDEALRDLIREQVSSGKSEFRAFTLDQEVLEKALGRRENRWKRVVGNQSQSLMELLFRQASEQGIQYFLLVTPVDGREVYPLYAGTMGVHCPDNNARFAKAYPYFKFEFTTWDVAAKKKVFRQVVDPMLTKELTFADCGAIAEMKELGKELELPVKDSLGLVVSSLFERMGWNKK